NPKDVSSKHNNTDLFQELLIGKLLVPVLSKGGFSDLNNHLRGKFLPSALDEENVNHHCNLIVWLHLVQAFRVFGEKPGYALPDGVDTFLFRLQLALLLTLGGRTARQEILEGNGIEIHFQSEDNSKAGEICAFGLFQH